MLQSLRPMNAIELLEGPHRRIESLLESLAGTKGDPPRQTGLFDAIANALAVHAEPEERDLYPLTPDEQVIVKSVREHLAIARRLTRLVRFHRSGRRLDTKLELPRARVMLHATRQEISLFPEVKQRLDGRELQALGGQMLATKRELAQDHAGVTAA